ncbi:MAG TPA: hypothetical protein VGR47_03820 [Terracidiphilus sp.]|nr:hypothetical protein [Terracidiphilus sp.]
MHELLIISGDAALLLVCGILVLLFLSLLGAMSQSKSFLASFPVLLLAPVLPLLSRAGINVLEWYSASAEAGGEDRNDKFRTVRQAMDYLVNRIVDEAKLQGTPLTEIERKMLYFSETDSTLRDMPAVSAEFDRSYNEDAYEEKICGLIKRIMARNQRQDHAAQAAWEDAVLKLSKGDYYLLALIGPLPAAANELRRPKDILRLWLAAFGIVFGGLAVLTVGNWLFGQGFLLHWIRGR